MRAENKGTRVRITSTSVFTRQITCVDYENECFPVTESLRLGNETTAGVQTVPILCNIHNQCISTSLNIPVGPTQHIVPT